MKLYEFSNDDFTRGAPRWKEALWWLVRSLIFASWLPIPSAIKVFWLRKFGASIGSSVVIRSRVNITFPWRLEIGDHVWIGDEVMILSLAPVRIGSNSCISQRAFICTGSHDFSKESFDLITEEIKIGNSCWVGAQAFIGPGISMKDGSRCLAGAVLVKDVEEGATVAGVPARPIEQPQSKNIDQSNVHIPS